MIKIHFLVITLLAIIGFPSFIFTLYSCGKLMVRLQPILAYGVPFNKEVLQEGGIYFKDAEDLANNMKMLERGEIDTRLMAKIQSNRIEKEYNWNNITNKYEKIFKKVSMG